jgi:hypothetical protein
VEAEHGQTEELAGTTVEEMAPLVKSRAAVAAPHILELWSDFYQHFLQTKHQFYWLLVVVVAVMMHLKVEQVVEPRELLD